MASELEELGGALRRIFGSVVRDRRRMTPSPIRRLSLVNTRFALPTSG
jgi:hypothetical protein